MNLNFLRELKVNIVQSYLIVKTSDYHQKHLQKCWKNQQNLKREKKIPFNCNKTFYRSWKNTAKQLNHMHHFLNYEQTVSSYRLCILRWPSPVLLQFMKHDKTTDKVDLCCRLFVLSTQMVCHNAMSPNTVSSFFSFICFTEVL